METSEFSITHPASTAPSLAALVLHPIEILFKHRISETAHRICNTTIWPYRLRVSFGDGKKKRERKWEDGTLRSPEFTSSTGVWKHSFCAGSLADRCIFLLGKKNTGNTMPGWSWSELGGELPFSSTFIKMTAPLVIFPVVACIVFQLFEAEASNTCQAERLL